jgi:hypothetical protein
MQKIKHSYQIQFSDGVLVSNKKGSFQIAINQLEQDLVELNSFVSIHPEWKESYKPYISTNSSQKNSVMAAMEKSVEFCNVGPMAAVAGALADRMKLKMLENHDVHIAVVENGGEISINSSEEIIIALIVLSSSLHSKLGFRYKGDQTDLGVATSSATFGHADSLGEADAVVVFAPSAALADAAATRICNEVKGQNPNQAIQNGIEAFREIPDLYGVFIVKGDLTARYGELPEIIRIKDEQDLLLHTKLKKKE